MEPKSTRPPVSKRLRFEVFRRDNFTCRYCGLHAGEDGAELTIDHVVPHTLGGTNDPSNLVTACKDCNAGKTSMAPGSPLVDDVAQDALRWAQAIKTAADVRATAREARAAYQTQFFQAWYRWTYGPKDDQQPLPEPPDALATVWQFYEMGVPIEELLDAVQIACSKASVRPESTWRYMCGVVYRKMDNLQRAARQILESGDV